MTRKYVDILKANFGSSLISGIIIGIFKGNDAEEVLQKLNIKKIYLIDPFLDYDEYIEGDILEGSSISQERYDRLYEDVCLKFKDYGDKVKIIRKKSEDAHPYIPNNSVDFVYIDGNHEYGFVKADINNYYIKLRKQGMMMGHNYEKVYDGLREAVDEFCRNNYFKVMTMKNENDTVEWYIRDDNYSVKSDTTYSHIKVFKHINKLNDIRDGIISEPISMRIKPTNKCNCDCFYCTYRKPAESVRDIKGNTYTFNMSDEIPQHIMKEIIEDIIDMNIKSVVFSGGGEPLIYPNIEKLIMPLYDNNIDVAFITNGLELRGEIAKVLAKSKWVRISLDCHTARLYSKMRNVSESMFDRLCDNIRNFLRIKDESCEVGINYVINHMNFNQVYDSALFMKRLELSHIKFYPRVTRITDKYHDDYMMNVISDIKKAKDELQTDTFKIINQYESGLDRCTRNYRTYSFCPIIQILPVIAADSKLYVCHDKAYALDGLIGDLTKVHLKDLWFSNHTKGLLQSFNVNDLCKYHCAYDQRNIIINEYLNLNEDNINFI